MTRSPSSDILRWVLAPSSWATRTGGSWRSSEGPSAINARTPTWLALVLALAAFVAPCRAQQVAQALELQKKHREALAIQEQFQKRLRAGKLDEAFALSKRSEALQRELIAGVEKAFPDNKGLAATFREILASILVWQAGHEEDRGNFDAALGYRREVLELMSALRGAGQWEVADARRLLARVDRLRALDPVQRRELAEAKASNRKVLDLSAQGRWSAALPIARRALEARERILGESDPDCAVSLVNLAGLHDELGDFARAEALYLRALEITRRALGRTHPQFARSVNNLAVLYHHAGDLARAEPYYRDALALTKQLLGEDGPDYTAGLTNLAALYRDLGRLTLAEPLAREAVDRTARALGDQDATYASQLNNLAAIYQANEQYDRAEPLYRKVLEIRKRSAGAQSAASARSLNNLAALYVDLGDPARAEPLFEESRQVWAQVAGEQHPEYARSLHNLAGCMLAKGEAARAEPLLRRALDIRKTSLGDRHPLAALTHEQLAIACAAQGRWTDALDHENDARRSLRRHVRRVLPALSARDQLAFLRSADQSSLNTALALGLARRGDAAAVRLSAGWILNGKGAVPEALAEQSLLARMADDPALAEAARRVQDARADLARAVNDAAELDLRAGRELVARLDAREQDLSAQLDRARDRSSSAEPWVEVDAVRGALGSGTVLVELARVAVYDFEARGRLGRWLPPRYAAWVIPAANEGEVQVVDLGAAESLDASVAAFRKAMAAGSESIFRQGEAKAEEEVRATLAAISERVLRPLEPSLKRAERWVVSPDSSLWLVPWEALLLADGRYSLERHAISYVVSGRELVARDGAVPAPQTGVLLADPDFDLAAAPRREAASGNGPGPLLRDAAGAIPNTWPALPGTADEAGTVLAKVEAFLGAEPRYYERGDAVEAVVKGARRPRVLLLCTHGFFLPDPPTASTRPLLDGATPSVPVENPLLRCGLVLAGANRRDLAVDPNGDDGILSGLEVLSADLRGTELVVLSACETGLGTIQNGQGVAGLRQAFHLAGAKAVMASLWKVPDEETAELMGRFWENRAAGRNPADALREAQRSVINGRREVGHAAHPFYWAAFTITGRLESSGSR